MGRKTKRLLVVDWDTFFPNPMEADCSPDSIGQPGGPELSGAFLYDWGHSESMSDQVQASLWSSRAAAFYRSEYSFLPTMNEEWEGFWKRFRYSSDCTIHAADSNSQAAAPDIMAGITDVFLYDAHHDAGYDGRSTIEKVVERGKVSCEDWMVAYYLLNNINVERLHVRYPAWKHTALEEKPDLAVDRTFDEHQDDGVRFDRVFVCRSGAWVPPWEDGKFRDFLVSRPGHIHVRMMLRSEDEEFPVRSWDDDQARAMAESMNEMLAKVSEQEAASEEG